MPAHHRVARAGRQTENRVKALLLAAAAVTLVACGGARGGSVSRSGLQLDFDSLSDTLPPVLLRLGRYRMPRQAIQCGYNGSVTVQFTIDSTGHVPRRLISILGRTNPVFDEPVLQMLTDSRFEPAKFRGRPLTIVVHDTISFMTSDGSGTGYPGPQPGCERR